MKTLRSLYQLPAKAHKIVVVDLGFLGDTVHLVPALWEIRRHYPAAPLHVLSAPVGAEVIRLVPCADRAWAFPLGPPSPPWWRHWGLIRALSRERFDLAFNFSGADRTILLTALTGARWRLGHQAGRHHFWNYWLIGHWVARQSANLPVYEQRRQVLAACGMNLGPVKFGLEPPLEATRWAEAFVPAQAIHLSLNASSHLKEWPLAHWVALTQNLLRGTPRPHLVASGSASPREQARLEALAAAADDARLQITPPEMTVAQLAALLARCSLHVGGDSGVLHLAMALGVPTVSIFRQYEACAEWLPVGAPHRHLMVPCPCATQSKPACLALESAACLARITPDQVADLVRQQLSLPIS